jgi:phage tail sheath protein FI
MVEDRQDTFYIADFSEADSDIADTTLQSNSVDSNYVATYYPWVKTIDNNNNKIMSVPPSVLLPGVFAANDRLAAEWFAPAGLNRGGITGAISVLNRLTHSERDTLYENKVNPIASFPGQGIVAFGQKTLQDKASALDRINVRRLLITVKKFIASTSRYLLFEQNTTTTRNRFLNTVNPYFEAIQQRQGLYAFKVVMDETNNTPDVIDRNVLAGQIFLQPAKTAEFIVIDFNILPTGASFNA